jgi:subtilisin family serine protease
MEEMGAEYTLPGTTGRFLVLLREDAVKTGVSALSDTLGLNVASSADFAAGAVDAQAIQDAGAMVFPTLGVAVVDVPPDQVQSFGVMANEDNGILAIEPERVNYAIDLPGTTLQAEYLVGYRDAINHLVDRVMGGNGASTVVAPQAGPSFADTADLTWGLQATRVAESRFSGKGVKVAVLDTGIDTGHPDFVGRQITTQSFVAGQTVQDGHGHGTHCIGTACGPKRAGQGPRYGIAYNAEIFAGKVLSNAGSGADGGILAGIDWAVTNKCAIVSMSLGAPTQPGQSFSQVFETAARRALAAGTLIVAAAGNESSRPGVVAPVGHPANCPSILSVGALDQMLQVAPFSCGGINPQGGQVDIAAPGVAVRSSWPRPTLYRTISGTSMATPHVAGIAALLKEANPAMQGGALGWLILQSSNRLSLLARDVGAGLAQAPA